VIPAATYKKDGRYHLMRHIRDKLASVAVLRKALMEAREHLEFCGYGDRFERECARESKLEDKIAHALEVSK